MKTKAKSIETVLYDLWDTGAKISQSVHTISSSLKQTKDHVFLTSVLKMRLICGDKNLFSEFQEKLSEKVLVEAVK